MVSNIFGIFTPTWGNDPIWRAYFSNGWFNHHLVHFSNKKISLLQDCKSGISKNGERWERRIITIILQNFICDNQPGWSMFGKWKLQGMESIFPMDLFRSKRWTCVNFSHILSRIGGSHHTRLAFAVFFLEKYQPSVSKIPMNDLSEFPWVLCDQKQSLENKTTRRNVRMAMAMVCSEAGGSIQHTNRGVSTGPWEIRRMNTTCFWRFPWSKC